MKLRFIQSPQTRRWHPLSLVSIGLASVLWLMPDLGLAQTTGSSASATGTIKAEAPASGTSTLVTLDEDYRIGVNDVIEVQIEDAAELSGSYRIAKSGGFLMPFLGRLTAVNKTPEELTKLITDGLRGRYLNDPIVKVVVRQYNSRSFFIQGAVRSPGVYQVEGKPSLLVLLTLAGGLATDNHSSTAFILRPTKQNQTTATISLENGSANETPAKTAESSPAAEAQTTTPQNEYTLLKVNINGLLVGRFEQNMYLEPGDIVNIPQSEVFFVAGEVQSPGSFALKEGTTLRHAISLAQGTNFKADMKRGIIFRDDPGTGKKKEINVDIAAVMKGKNEDIPILANDIIVVPNSRMKSVTAPLLSALGTQAVRIPVY
ncbi:MAG: SLBB domain-containing protein [Acidobacteria bacterium]|nr:SLBB domain-containing protein [Acidobacteriota bacterium]